MGNFIGRLAIEPTGRFAYACSGGAFLAFSIDQSSGVLTPIPGPTLSAGSAPFNPTADPSGTFLFVIDGVSNAAIDRHLLALHQTRRDALLYYALKQS